MRDNAGKVRFRANVLVRYLLDNANITLTDLAAVPCSEADREQLAMLIGYSLDGFAELPYVTEETYRRALAAREESGL